MDASRRLRDLQSQPGNKICVDCSQKNPQWASISYGVFMCLECSGKHRGLGVHISFVRSVTMDSWSEIQLRKMELGGNANLNTFLSKYGISKETDIVTKYNTNAASVFRDKIQSLAEGKPWRDPPVVKETLKGGGAGGGNNNNRKPPLSGGAGTRVDNSGWDSWDNFDDGTSHHNNNNNLRRNQSVGDFRSGSGGGGGGVRGGNGTPPARSQSTQNIFSQSQLEASAANKEDFFARKKAANEMRPDGIPPSQGGKYVGFGSSSAPVPRSASQGDVLSAVTQVIDDYKVNETVSVVTAKTTEIGQKTWGIMKGVMALASQKVEEFTKEGSSGWQINESEKNGQYQEFGKQQSNGRHSSSVGAQPSSNRQQSNSVSSGSSWDDWGDSKDNKKEESRKEAATSHTDSWAGWDDKDDDDDGFETSYQTVSNSKVKGYNEKSDAKWTGGGFR